MQAQVAGAGSRLLLHAAPAAEYQSQENLLTCKLKPAGAQLKSLMCKL
jgi:hypothetical protein